MATILVLKRRIQAAKNVSKTTRAMQMIAASKLKNAQNATLATRPYVERLTSVSQSLTGKIDSDNIHPYLQTRNLTGKQMLIVVSSDKGLCGGLIANVLRELIKTNDEYKNITFLTVGKKIEGQVGRLNKEIVASFTFGNTTPTLEMVYPVIRIIKEQYLANMVDTVRILSTHFSSIFTQVPKVSTLLPITVPEKSLEKEGSSFLFEPNLVDILPSLLQHYLEMALYQYLLESFVSEQASRMIAMQSATDNANAIIEDLRLEYNKTRQEKITNEILDISAGSMPLSV